jgi:hypothetical protein
VYHNGKLLDFRTAVRLYGRPKSAAGQAHKMAQQQKKAQQKMLQEQQKQQKLQREEENREQQLGPRQQQPLQQPQTMRGLQLQQNELMEQHQNQLHQHQNQQQQLQLQPQAQPQLQQQPQQQQSHVERRFIHGAGAAEAVLADALGHHRQDLPNVRTQQMKTSRAAFTSLPSELTRSPSYTSESLRPLEAPSFQHGSSSRALDCASWPRSAFSKASPSLDLFACPGEPLPTALPNFMPSFITPPSSSMSLPAQEHFQADHGEAMLHQAHTADLQQQQVHQQVQRPQNRQPDSDIDLEAKRIMESDAYRQAWSKTNSRLLSLLQAGHFGNRS